jgi:putative hydrolase of the HAD superfamily
MMIRAVLLDFGGVIAEEGFQQGLYAIAEMYGHEQESFFKLATEAVYNTGYVTGTGTETEYWQAVKEQAGIRAADKDLRREILTRFIPRQWMLDSVAAMQKQGIITAILSDQSDWLDKLDSQYNFFQYFTAVFNSYHLGKTKRDIAIFDETVQALQVKADEALFVDDNPGHIERANSRGLQTHLFTERHGYFARLEELGIAFQL